MQSRCKDCSLKKRIEYYQNNKEKHRTYQKNRKENILKTVFEIKQTSKCKDCGETDPVVLEFDHQKNKIDDVSNMISKEYGFDKILKEIKKCDIVCANCHRKRTAKKFNWYKFLRD